MRSEHTIEAERAGAARELRRAARDVDAVEVVDASERAVRLRGDAESMQSVRRALWARQLSAEQFGQDGLAAADASARGQLTRSS